MLAAKACMAWLICFSDRLSSFPYLSRLTLVSLTILVNIGVLVCDIDSLDMHPTLCT